MLCIFHRKKKNIKEKINFMSQNVLTEIIEIVNYIIGSDLVPNTTYATIS